MPRSGSGGSPHGHGMKEMSMRQASAPRKVRTNTIVANPRNLREGDLWDNDEQRDQMVASMREVGQISALVVCSRSEFDKLHPGYDLGDAEFVILAGHRRHEALVLAGIVETRIDLRDEQLPNADLLMIEENMKRKALTVFQEAEGYRRMEAAGDSHQKIAIKVGRSKSHITKRIALLNLPSDARAALTAKQLTIDTAYNLFVKLGPENVHLLLDANEYLRANRDLTVDAAVNQVLLGTIPSQPAAAPEKSDEPVLAEPAAADASTREPAVDGPAPVLPEPAAADAAAQPRPGAKTGSAGTASSSEPASAAAPTSGQTSPSAQPAEPAQQAIASALRDQFCSTLIEKYTQPVADAQATRIAETVILQASNAALKRVLIWLQRIDPATTGELTETGYRDTVMAQNDPVQICRLAYAVSIAESELRATNRARTWDARDAAYLKHLVDGGYTPSAWEQQHLS
ncbi:ParB/RepB/Spo0J family partition protein [Streptomyces hydrogenans]|uniref:ParB/RepB/Spo0J family partition protein n=1 Tax=Streptomyces hydrogenans TaxID=1873719 RepID=UPI0036E9D2E3